MLHGRLLVYVSHVCLKTSANRSDGWREQKFRTAILCLIELINIEFSKKGNYLFLFAWYLDNVACR
jgi:hypothetical protein